MTDAARIRSGKAAALVGVTRKTLLKWARDGIIPGAAELTPRVWSFDRYAIERWVKEREAGTCRTTSTSGKASGTPVCRLEAVTSDAAYERLLGLRR